MIEAQIARLEASLVALSGALVLAETRPFPPNVWNARDIAAHMLQVEIECHWQRIQRISNGENPHYSYYYNTNWDFSGQELHKTLDEWATWRKRVIALARRLDVTQLAQTGTHDYFGTITVADVLKIAADHDQEHIEDLKK